MTSNINDSPKCFFVGMHNKPSMTPLDSRTRTGRVIDEIIEKLQLPVTKTNLCEVDYLPKDTAEIKEFAATWHTKYQPKHGDVIVLLGRWVNNNFQHNNCKVVPLTHPAGIFGTRKRAEYIKETICSIALAFGQSL